MSDRNDDEQFKRWAFEVKKRDGFTCQICGARGTYLESHHKNGWNAFPEQRYNIDNGACLCKKHHDSFHEQFGYGGNTEYQYKQYEEIAVILRKIAQKNFDKKEDE